MGPAGIANFALDCQKRMACRDMEQDIWKPMWPNVVNLSLFTQFSTDSKQIEQFRAPFDANSPHLHGR